MKSTSNQNLGKHVSKCMRIDLHWQVSDQGGKSPNPKFNNLQIINNKISRAKKATTPETIHLKNRSVFQYQ